MFAEPTINDFLDCVRSHLDQATDRARRGVAQVEAKARRSGVSGNTISQIFEEVHREFDAGVIATLGELKRAVRRTKLDARELRQHTVQCLENFAIAVKSITHMDYYKTLGGPGVADYIEGKFAEFDARLRLLLRQFDTGFFDPIEPENPDVTKNEINIGSMIGGAIQQASPHAKQAVEFELNLQTANNALTVFEAAIKDAVPDVARADMLQDVQTIRAQLSKRTPSKAIIREAAQSLRNVIEGIGAGMLTPAVTAAASSLWSALGLG